MYKHHVHPFSQRDPYVEGFVARSDFSFNGIHVKIGSNRNSYNPKTDSFYAPI
jgi:hypothetical protein